MVVWGVISRQGLRASCAVETSRKHTKGQESMLVQGFHGRRGVKPCQQQLYIVTSQVCPQLSDAVPIRFPWLRAAHGSFRALLSTCNLFLCPCGRCACSWVTRRRSASTGRPLRMLVSNQYWFYNICFVGMAGVRAAGGRCAVPLPLAARGRPAHQLHGVPALRPQPLLQAGQQRA